jgi:hypothetical protein
MVFLRKKLVAYWDASSVAHARARLIQGGNASHAGRLNRTLLPASHWRCPSAAHVKKAQNRVVNVVKKPLKI